MITDRVSIDRSQYEGTWKYERASSLPDFPREPRYARYLCTSTDFLNCDSYPCWFTDAARTTFLGKIEDDCQRPIRFAELLSYPHLVSRKLREFIEADRRRPCLHVIVEHCTRCNVHVVKDGNKQLLAVATQNVTQLLRVTEVAGDDWSSARYDMKKVCRCADTASHRS